MANSCVGLLPFQAYPSWIRYDFITHFQKGFAVMAVKDKNTRSKYLIYIFLVHQNTISDNMQIHMAIFIYVNYVLSWLFEFEKCFQCRCGTKLWATVYVEPKISPITSYNNFYPTRRGCPNRFEIPTTYEQRRTGTSR